MAPHPRQSLELPFRGANFLPRSPPAVRPSWRLTPGKALCHRSEAPTFSPGVSRWGARVGASPPAKPYATVTRRQLFAPESVGRPPELAPHPRQKPYATVPRRQLLPRSLPVGRPSWSLIPGKALNYRHEATTRLPSLWLNLRKMLSSCESCRCMNGPICLELQTCIKIVNEFQDVFKYY